jgi:putative spermidine/putrescine transport system ATP-binding protein
MPNPALVANLARQQEAAEAREPVHGTRTADRASVSSFLRLIGVRKSFGHLLVAADVSLDLRKGERVSLLGPSGCGKTTLLNLIAGFIQPDAGSIEIGGRDMANVPSHRRNLGIVFQNYALFPHLTVFENIRFGLKMRSVSAALASQRIREVLQLVRLGDLADRFPQQLSGGQQQRVAIARALVIEPELLLLDEPLSNLDAKLRESMRIELLDLLKKLGVTTILVTHDQAEALALSDRIAVLNQGRLEQVGTPREIYEEPATSFVAGFVGESNVLPGKVAEVLPHEIKCVLTGGQVVRCRPRKGMAQGHDVEVIVRIERVRLNVDGVPEADNVFAGTVEQVLFLGGEVRCLLRLGDQRIIASDKNRGDGAYPQAGVPVHISWSVADSIVSLPEEVSKC